MYRRSVVHACERGGLWSDTGLPHHRPLHRCVPTAPASAVMAPDTLHHRLHLPRHLPLVAVACTDNLAMDDGRLPRRPATGQMAQRTSLRPLTHGGREALRTALSSRRRLSCAPMGVWVPQRCTLALAVLQAAASVASPGQILLGPVCSARPTTRQSPQRGVSDLPRPRVTRWRRPGPRPPGVAEAVPLPCRAPRRGCSPEGGMTATPDTAGGGAWPGEARAHGGTQAWYCFS